ncbi:Hpt domain-containing protein [Echinicola soli]|uniref:Hpt domain-containing protein n=1 Tax=Echinicola soli TaxID=2591634 RepID=A0A514CLI1_9BACT|nr:Hpt domain-containing protein [Echinicola soli]QDH80658.1 Hpt domain-containing protein [Echinicola soli]
MYELINKDVIFQFLGDDPELIRPMLEMVLNNNLTELEELDSLYQKGNYDEVRIKVHKAKSAMGYVGASSTKNLLQEIEKDVANTYPKNISALKAEIEIIKKEISDFLKSM